MQEDSVNNKQKPYKVILVGFQAVGKSSLLNRIIQSKFQPDYTTTIGIDFRLVRVPISNKQVILQIWDTAGQQKFAALTNSYFNGSQGCLVVYDLQDKTTLEKARDYIDNALSHGISRQCIFLIGNKSDQGRQCEQEGRDMADTMKINFEIASAKTGQNINQMINNIAVALSNIVGQLYYEKGKPKLEISEQNQKRCGC